MLRSVVTVALATALALTVLAGSRWTRPDRASYASEHGPVRVLGELRTADRVAVLVPGVGIDKAHLGAPDQVLGMARALAAQARRQAPDVRLAVLAWADYPAPAGLGLAVVRGRRATVGAHRLDAFLDLVRDRTDAPIDLFCHSYGSVVCGLTPLRGRVADIVLYGSPGVRLDRACEFGPHVRAWAARNAHDWIRFVPHIRLGDLGHGRDPMDPAFGARVLSSRGADGHGDYYAPGSESLANFARIATGRFDAVACARAGSTGL